MKPCFLLCLRVLASCVCCRQWSPGTRVHIHAKCLTGIWAVGQLAGCPWWLLNTAEVCWVRSVCFKLLLNLPKKVTTWTNIRFNLWANVHSGSFYFQWIYLTSSMKRTGTFDLYCRILLTCGWPSQTAKMRHKETEFTLKLWCRIYSATQAANMSSINM